MPVRRLDPVLVDRIAAGEVIERPAAAVKELVENALDAGATRIEVAIESGGRQLIRVIDNGQGMSAADLDLAIERHATSKLPDGDLSHIGTLGFRGEALPSIGSVATLDIFSRTEAAREGSHIRVDQGLKRKLVPAAQPQGTRVEVRELFAATPARLKFLKTDRSESQAVVDVVQRLAMAHPQVRFALSGPEISGFDYAPCAGDGEGLLRRLTQILGKDFQPNALPLEAEREGCPAPGFRRPADLASRQCEWAIFLRQRPPGARQALRRGGARRLCRLFCRRGVIRRSCSFSLAIRARWMLMCIRRRRRCASAIRASCVALSSAR